MYSFSTHGKHCNKSTTTSRSEPVMRARIFTVRSAFDRLASSIPWNEHENKSEDQSKIESHVMEQQHASMELNFEDMEETPAYLENPGGDAVTRIQMPQHLQLGCLDHPDLQVVHQAVRDEPFQQRGVLNDDLFEPPLPVSVAVGDAKALERLGDDP